MKVGSASVDGRGRPSEDRQFIAELPGGKGAILGVLDGHSGSFTAEFSRQHLPDAIRAAVGRAGEDEAALRKELKECFVEHDRLLAKQGALHYRTSGSTATVVIVTERWVVFAYIGDSPAFLMDAESGRIVHAIARHTPDVPAERQRIERNGGTVEHEAGDAPRVNGELMVSRAFGDFSLKFENARAPEWGKNWSTDFLVVPEPDINILPRPARGIVAVMSDGLVEPASGEGLKPLGQVAKSVAAAIAQSGGDLKRAADLVCRRHVAETAPRAADYDGDDLTLILFDIGTAGTHAVTNTTRKVHHGSSGSGGGMSSGKHRRAKTSKSRGKLPKVFTI